MNLATVFLTIFVVTFTIVFVLMLSLDYRKRKHQRTYIDNPRVDDPSKDCTRP